MMHKLFSRKQAKQVLGLNLNPERRNPATHFQCLQVPCWSSLVPSSAETMLQALGVGDRRNLSRHISMSSRELRVSVTLTRINWTTVSTGTTEGNAE